MRHSSYLVQRLERPFTTGLLAFKDNPFSFGGGYKNGGLSAEAMGLLRPIFSFDYMGAAEFEFGAVPKALQEIASRQESLVITEVAIPLKKVKEPWVRAGEQVPSAEGIKLVYVLAPKEWTDEIHRRILLWAYKPEHKDAYTKERVGLNTALRPVTEYDERLQGWLELDNGFFFFIDQEMCAKTAAVFGVEMAGVGGRPEEDSDG